MTGIVVGIDGSPPAEAKHQAEALLARAVETIGHDAGVEIETVAAPGHPPAVLVEQSEGATLLVVGTLGRGGFASLVLGSVSQGGRTSGPLSAGDRPFPRGRSPRRNPGLGVHLDT
jgi:nucleotide-binding universal stress UspA family protein